MLNFFFKIILFLTLTITTSVSEIVKSIEVNGNNRISKETIIVFSKINIGQDLSENNLNKIIIDLFETNFFKDVNLSLIDNVLLIQVEENPIIQTLDISGIKNKSLKEKIMEIIILTDRSSYKELFAKRDVNTILNVLRSVGYYFSDVNYIVTYNENNTVDLDYQVTLGDKASINQIRFIGEKIYKDRKLLSVITSEENRFWKVLSNKKFIDKQRISLDQRLLKNFYLNRGYYKAQVNQSYANMLDTKKFDLTFNINSGPKFFFNEFNLLLPEDYNNENFSKLYELFNKLKDKTYSLDKIDEILNEIDKIALNDQFEFISATVNERIVNKNKINFTFEIVESEKKYVETVNIFGNTITREEVIRNSLKVDEGDPFNELLHNKTINELKSKNLFAKVESEVIEGSTKDYKTINITVEEKPTGEISVGAGYGTRGGALGFTIKENNFLGKGVKLITDISYSANSKSANFSYTEPNFAYSGRSLTGNLSSSVVDALDNYGYESKTNELEFSTYYEQYEDFYFSPAISLKHENLTTNSKASDQYEKQKGTYTDITVPYGLIYDKRNSSYQPKEGFISRFEQEIPLVSNTASISNTYNLTKYFSIGDNVINSVDFFVKAVNSISSKDVRVSKRVNLSGKRLRGFEVGKIGPTDNDTYVGGNYAASVNFVSQLPNILPTLQNTDFSFFLDIANVWGVDYSSTLDDNGAIRSAIGVGVDWFTPIGPLNFSLSQAITSEKTDKKETFRFNLGTTF